MRSYRFRFIADMNITAQTPDEALEKIKQYFEEVLAKDVRKSFEDDNEIFLINTDTEEKIEIGR